MADATSLDRSRTLKAIVDAPFLDVGAKVDTLFLATFTRMPTERERAVMTAHLEKHSASERRRDAYAEVLWALLNSPEFVLCR
jgi:hypothetical protein